MEVNLTTIAEEFTNLMAKKECGEKEHELMEFWVDGVLKIALACCGIFINTIAIWILIGQEKMQTMFLHILTCSFIVDNGYMLMEILVTMYFDFQIYSLAWILPHLAFPFKGIFYTFHQLITVALSYERYALIENSNGYKQTMDIPRFRYQRLKKYVLIIALFSLIFNSPMFFTHWPYRTGNICKSFNIKSTWFGDSTAYKITKSIKEPILLVICFMLLVFLNWKLFKNVQEKNGIA